MRQQSSEVKVYRQWLILGMIPAGSAGRKVGTMAIRDRLEKEHGITVSLRTIQRDLIGLERIFPFLYCDSLNPAGWRWRDNFHFSIPGMDLNTALALHLADVQAGKLLPKAALTALRPYLDKARNLLEVQPGNAVSAWTNKVMVVSRGIQMQPASVHDEVINEVYNALFTDLQLKVCYKSRGKEKAQTFIVNPLGLVFVEGVITLVCTIAPHTNTIQLVLHRMESATTLDTPSTAPDGFSLAAYTPELGIPLDDKPMTLKVLFEADAAHYLFETPFPAEHTLSKQEDNKVLLTAQTFDSQQLRWWLRGFGQRIEVLAPLELLKEFREMAEQLGKMYA